MELSRVGSKALIREINEALVLQEIRSRGLVSRAELARSTGVGVPTVSAIVARLLQIGLVEERSTGATTGGRPPVLLAIKPGSGFVVGLKLTETRVIGVLTDLEGGIVAGCTVAVEDTDVDSVVEDVVVAVEMLVPAAAGGQVFGVGAGLAGLVDRDAGLVRQATYFDWTDVPLAARVKKATGLPVVIDNDVNTLVVSEQLWGAGRDVQDFVLASIGRGVGMGLVLGGRLHRGAVGGAGELGHFKVQMDGPQCACGSRGCLEAFIGQPALEAAASALLGAPTSIDEAADLARDGDLRIRNVFADAGSLLGMALGSLVNVLDPAHIVLAGEGMRYHDLFLPSCRDALQRSIFGGTRAGLSVHVASSDDAAWARGAASLLLGELFRPHLSSADVDRPSLISRPSG